MSNSVTNANYKALMSRCSSAPGVLDMSKPCSTYSVRCPGFADLVSATMAACFHLCNDLAEAPCNTTPQTCKPRSLKENTLHSKYLNRYNTSFLGTVHFFPKSSRALITHLSACIFRKTKTGAKHSMLLKNWTSCNVGPCFQNAKTLFIR
jgi:hypothetical protein